MKFTVIGLIVMSALAAGAFAATEERLSAPELTTLNECMALKPDALAADGRCAAVMKKANVTAGDVERMRRCESKFNVEPRKDPDCAAMIKKHPDLVRGHGALMPEETGKSK